MIRPQDTAVRSAARAVLILAAGFGAAELGVRALDAHRGFSPRARTAWFWLYEADPRLGFRGRPHTALTTPLETIQHNAEGFRDDRDLGAIPPPRERRLILCVGDGGTYGLGAGSNQLTYPAVLERELRARSGDSRFVVLNAGVPNYTSHEIALLLEERLASLAPERVVAMTLKEDFEFLDLSPEESELYRFHPLRIEGLWATPLPRLFMTSSFLGRLADKRRPARVDDFGVRRALPSHQSAGAEGARRYLRNVKRMAEASRRAGATLLMVDQPIHYSVCAYSDTKADEAERLRRDLRGRCLEWNVPVLDAHTTLDWHGLRLSDDNLLGRLGYERLAKLLAPQILALDAATTPKD